MIKFSISPRGLSMYSWVFLAAEDGCEVTILFLFLLASSLLSCFLKAVSGS